MNVRTRRARAILRGRRTDHNGHALDCGCPECTEYGRRQWWDPRDSIPGMARVANDMYFDRQGNPMGTYAWARAFADARYKRIGSTTITSTTDPTIKLWISTVWLGLNHAWITLAGEPAPRLQIFETMVFSDASNPWSDTDLVRYATEQEALTGHADTVTLVRATIPNEKINDARKKSA